MGQYDCNICSSKVVYGYSEVYSRLVIRHQNPFHSFPGSILVTNTARIYYIVHRYFGTLGEGYVYIILINGNTI